MKEEKPSDTPLPEVILSLIGHGDPKVRKILIDLIYSLYSLIPDLMDKYNVQIWTLLKNTKTDKNKFVREASLACLKKFGPLLKESLPEKAKKKSVKTRPGKKKRNKAFFDKNKKNPKKKSERGMKHASSKEIKVKMGGSGGGEIGKDKNIKMRGKIINKKMNLKNVKGRLDLKKLKAQFQQKKGEENDGIEIKFKEPEKKIDYQKWIEEPVAAIQTVELKKKNSKRKIMKKKSKKKVGFGAPSFEMVENKRGASRSPDRVVEDEMIQVIQDEKIPELFSDEEEMHKRAGAQRPILNGSQRNHDLDRPNQQFDR